MHREESRRKEWRVVARLIKAAKQLIRKRDDNIRHSRMFAFNEWIKIWIPLARL